MTEDEKELRDLARLVVPAAGSLQETGCQADPYRLVDPAGAPVGAVTAYFRDLQAAGRSAATLRSHGMDLRLLPVYAYPKLLVSVLVARRRVLIMPWCR